MITFLAKKLIPEYRDYHDENVRRSYGVLCGSVGIVLNLLLFALKFVSGLFSGSIAITADAFNNLSDAGSSLVSLLGFKLSGQQPDKEHPFGHGRLEYVAGLVVAGLILLMGVELLQGSLEKIRTPSAVEVSWLVLAILALSVLVKFYMWHYNRAVAKKIDSAVIAATATDSLSDAAATAVVLLATAAYRFVDWPLDGWLGLLVAALVLRAGFLAARDTVNPLLGQPPSLEFVEEVEKLVRSHEEIIGIHDLIVHDYGPGRRMVTLHAEVDAAGDMLALHDVVDTVENELVEALNCLATIHMDPVCTDETTGELRRQVEQLVKTIDTRITIHDFRMVGGPTHTNLIFDAVVPFGMEKSGSEIAKEIRSLVQRMEGNCFAVVRVETGYTGEE